MVPDFEEVCLKIRSAIDNTAFGIGIGVTHEQEENTTAGHLQHDGVLVDIVREGGGWVEDLMVRPGSTSARTCGGRRSRRRLMLWSRAWYPLPCFCCDSSGTSTIWRGIMVDNLPNVAAVSGTGLSCDTRILLHPLFIQQTVPDIDNPVKVFQVPRLM